jgi:hypothetical protein
LTDLCKSEKKYSWSEVLEQLQPIMKDLQIDVNWDECERHLEKYLEKASRALPSLRPEGR